MATISCDGWSLNKVPEAGFLHLGPQRVPIFIRWFARPNNNYAIVQPQGFLGKDLWLKWVNCCRAYASFDPKGKFWVWGKLALLKHTSISGVAPSTSAPAALTVEEREKARAERRKASELFDAQLAELSKAENVPQELWDTFKYPEHLPVKDPPPTALQRIVVSRYWDKPHALLGCSVGSGKSRMAVNVLEARALAPNAPELNDSVRIVLVVAPLSLHENWKREFAKWQSPGVEWHVHRFAATTKFWQEVEASANHLWEGKNMRPGGIVLITTPQSLSRPTLMAHFERHSCVPTAIVVDEVQRFFRHRENRAFQTLMQLRRKAHCIITLSGTPTSKLEDFWALEEALSPGSHWNDATYEDYQKLGDREFMADSGLHQRGWDFERGIKEYHAYRIRTGRIFMADKKYYMKDALPGLDQQELGEFADVRLTFRSLFENEECVKQAIEFQQKQKEEFRGSDSTLAQVLLLRMQQIAANSKETQQVLDDFVTDVLEPEEQAVIWCMFRSPPCEELPGTVRYVSQFGPTGWIMGGMKDDQKWGFIDAFQAKKLRFLVCQTEAGGVGLNLVSACKTLFLSIPLGYQSVSQCIGRLHRIGQTRDVTSYFAMTHPVAAFARNLYDKRVELNEEIPAKITGLVSSTALPS